MAINEAAACKPDMEKPVGKKLFLVNPGDGDQPDKIIGITKNFNYASLHHKIRPQVSIYMNSYPANLSVQLNPS
ncbi:MAG: hypothetical protein ACOCTU_00340 [Bacteroidota bacterium]